MSLLVPQLSIYNTNICSCPSFTSASADYFLLEEHSVSQINGAFCGPASSTMVLNALNVPRPIQDGAEHPWLNKTQYAYFDQENVFNNATEAVLPKAQVEQQVRSCIMGTCCCVTKLRTHASLLHPSRARVCMLLPCFHGAVMLYIIYS